MTKELVRLWQKWGSIPWSSNGSLHLTSRSSWDVKPTNLLHLKIPWTGSATPPYVFVVQCLIKQSCKINFTIYCYATWILIHFKVCALWYYSTIIYTFLFLLHILVSSSSYMALRHLNGFLPVGSVFWPLFPICNFSFINVSCTQLYLFFGRPLSRLPFGLLLNTWLSFLLFSILLT